MGVFEPGGLEVVVLEVGALDPLLVVVGEEQFARLGHDLCNPFFLDVFAFFAPEPPQRRQPELEASAFLVPLCGDLALARWVGNAAHLEFLDL